MALSLIEGVSNDSMMMQISKRRVESALKLLDDRLKDNKWLAGDELTLADIMSVYAATTQRYWSPLSYAGYDNILRWLKDVSERPAYQRAMQKGDPEMKILNGPDAPDVGMIQAGGTSSNHWKK
jgi:glutathione S-transferase